MPPQCPLHVLLLGEDCRLRESLVQALERDDSIETVRVIDVGSRTPQADLHEPDVALHAGHSDPNLLKELIAVLCTSDRGKEAHELAGSAVAVAYLKDDPSIADVAPTVILLAKLAAAQWPL